MPLFIVDGKKNLSLLMVVKMAMTEMLVVVKKEAKMEMVLVGKSSPPPTFRTSEVNFCRKSRF